MSRRYIPGMFSGATNAKVSRYQVAPSCQKCHQSGHWTYKCTLDKPKDLGPRGKRTNIVYDDVPEGPRITDGDFRRDPVIREERLQAEKEEAKHRAAEQEKRDQEILAQRLEERRHLEEAEKSKCKSRETGRPSCSHSEKSCRSQSSSCPSRSRGGSPRRPVDRHRSRRPSPDKQSLNDHDVSREQRPTQLRRPASRSDHSSPSRRCPSSRSPSSDVPRKRREPYHRSKHSAESPRIIPPPSRPHRGGDRSRSLSLDKVCQPQRNYSRGGERSRSPSPFVRKQRLPSPSSDLSPRDSCKPREQVSKTRRRFSADSVHDDNRINHRNRRSRSPEPQGYHRRNRSVSDDEPFVKEQKKTARRRFISRSRSR